MNFNNFGINQQQLAVNFVIENLFYVPVGNYQPMFVRPYMAAVTEEAVSTVVDRMLQQRSTTVNSGILNGVAAEILQPSAVAMPSLIDHNWVSERRYIFMLIVSYTDVAGFKHTCYLQGYTNFDGIARSMGNAVAAPDMVHHVNNIIETTTTLIHTPMGVQQTEKLFKIYNVACNDSTHNEVYTVRPIDIISRQSQIDICNAMGADGMSMKNNLYTLSPYGVQTVCNASGNNMPVDYLVRYLNATMSGYHEQNTFMNTDMVYDSEVKSPLQETTLRDNLVMRSLSKLSGMSVTTPDFKYGTILALDPSIDKRFQVFDLNKGINTFDIGTPEVGDHWQGQDALTVKAYSIIEAGVALAMQCGFSKMVITASNMASVLGGTMLTVTSFNSLLKLNNEDQIGLVELFKLKFENQIFLNETKNNMLPMQVELHVDMLGTSKVFISDGYNSNWYTIPTFANASFAPVITYDNNNALTVAQQLGNLTEALYSGVYNTGGHGSIYQGV